MNKKICILLYVLLGGVLLLQIFTYKTLSDEEAMYIEAVENESTGWILGALELLYTRIQILISGA